ncbi:hypothetical protein D915_005284 [Fasciola hepatica]|uniref:Ephrin RBD domain-containing protein n=1 Tax=Fasciola hepatica TaxID=6192 RepID=A0A4E0RA46_FASHE|nr:hypothetical protein D915_005284 [Fasciola hepatica]
MNWPNALTFICYGLVLSVCKMHQDHIILWTSEDQKISDAQFVLRVREGDNIIFICPKAVNAKQHVYWTHNRLEFNKCNLSAETNSRKLLDCGDQRSGPDFILKVSQFSEISQIPTFHKNTVLYFLSQPEYCLQHRLKMAAYMYFAESETHLAGSPASKEDSQIPYSHSEHEEPDSFSSMRRDNNKAVWTHYRFLFIPGILGLLTMIGLQAIICVLWKRWHSRSGELSARSENDGTQRYHLCYLCRFCSGSDNDRIRASVSKKTGSKQHHTTLSNPTVPGTAARGTPKRVEFSSEPLPSEKSHSHMGIGTMPKHLIPQNLTITHPVHDSTEINLRVQKELYHSKAYQSTGLYFADRLYSHSTNGKLLTAECVGTMQRCCSDRLKCTSTQPTISSDQPCLFTDDCRAHIVPVSNRTVKHTTTVLTDRDKKQDKIINISV